MSPNGQCEGVSASTDLEKNVYITGFFSDTMYLGNDTLKASNNTGQAFILKYDGTGNMQWATQSYSPIGNSWAVSTSIATDRFNNVYITGTFSDTVNFGKTQLISTLNNFIAKYNSSGNVIWAKQYEGEYSSSIATDTVGNVYITGYFQGTVTFGVTTLSASSMNVFVVKLDSNGNVIWANQSTSSSGFCGPLIYVSVDLSGNVYLAGDFFTSITFGAYTLNSTAIAKGDAFLTKYNPAGHVVWAKQSSSPGISYGAVAYSVTNDRLCNVYITGGFYSQTQFGTTNLSSSNTDIFLVKYDSTGIIKWIQYGTTDGNPWFGYSLATDTFNNIYLSGGANKGLLTKYQIKFNSDSVSTLGTTDGVSILYKFDSSGNALCSSILAGGADDNNTLASDPTGNYVYLGGDLYCTMVAGKDTLNHKNNSEVPFMTRWYGCNINPMVSVIQKNQSCYNQCSSSATVRTSEGIPPYTYSWSTSPIQSNQTATGLCAGRYSVRVKDFRDSTIVDTISIDNCPELPNNIFIPDAFSPNNDGQNDLLLAKGNGVETFYMAIYDRWGNKVFETYNFNIGWDGTYKGKPEDAGTYVYYVSGTYAYGIAFNKKGSVSLVR